MAAATIRIGSASGFWGDTALAVGQLLKGGRLDYLVFDYLAEVTMSILAMQKAKNPSAGYASDFVDITLREHLVAIKAQSVKVVANAGGVNPLACRDAIVRLAEELGVAVKVGVVLGDDLSGNTSRYREAGLRDMFSGMEFPARPASVNAYLGALPIASALDAGCDIVVTGRCVDSAVTVGAMMHAFGWAANDYDKLAQASLAGHLVECGAQCTGGLFTDWQRVPDWENIGFPIIEAKPDGTFLITKSPETGGLVEPASVTEQMLYEISDPRAYMLPDVTCDFTQVRFEALAAGEDGQARVGVSGAIGRPPSEHYKVSVTFADGFRNTAFLTIVGEQAAAKALRTGEAILTRVDKMLAALQLPGLSAKRIEVLGAETTYGAQAAPGLDRQAREVVLKIAVKSASKASLEVFAREFAPAATSMSPGTTGLVGGRPSPAPVVRLASFLVLKREVPISVDVMGQLLSVEVPGNGGFDAQALPPAHVFEAAVADATQSDDSYRLIDLAWARSGDKGNIANIGVIARQARYLPWILASVTTQSVAQWFAHNFEGPEPARVERFDLPGSNAVNFVLHDVLGGGGMASLHTDNLAKTYAQVLLSMPVKMPRALR